MIRLLLADDQALVRGALAALLDLESDLEVVVEVGSGDAVVPAALEHRPDVALLDVEMPGMDGIAAAAALAEALPSCRVLIVTTFGRPGFLRRALKAGASGFVVKDTPAAQLADAVRRVHQGLRVVDPALATDSLVAGESPLTERLEQWKPDPAHDQRVTTRVPCGEYFPVRDRALIAHATQIDPDGFFFQIPMDLQQSVWPTEDFELVRSLVDTTTPEDDLFAGVRESAAFRAEQGA